MSKPKTIILIFLHGNCHLGEYTKGCNDIICESRTVPQHTYLSMDCKSTVNFLLVSRRVKLTFAIPISFLKRNRTSTALLYNIHLGFLHFLAQQIGLCMRCPHLILPLSVCHGSYGTEIKNRIYLCSFLGLPSDRFIGHVSDVTDSLCISVIWSGIWKGHFLPTINSFSSCCNISSYLEILLRI